MSLHKLDDTRTWFDKALAVRRDLVTTDSANAGLQFDLCLAVTKIAELTLNPDEARQNLNEGSHQLRPIAARGLLPT